MALGSRTGIKYDRYNSRVPYDIGDFTEKIEHIRKVQKPNKKGFAETKDVSLRKPWCLVMDLNGKENTVYYSLNNNEKRKFVIRGTKKEDHIPRIQDFIIWDKKIYSILNIQKVGKGQWYELIAEVNEQCQQ